MTVNIIPYQQPQDFNKKLVMLDLSQKYHHYY